MRTRVIVTPSVPSVSVSVTRTFCVGAVGTFLPT